MSRRQLRKERLRQAIEDYSLRELLECKLADIVELVDGVDGEHNLYREIIGQSETVLLKTVLAKTPTQLAAARLLGINRNTLRKKIKELNLESG